MFEYYITLITSQTITLNNFPLLWQYFPDLLDISSGICFSQVKFYTDLQFIRQIKVQLKLSSSPSRDWDLDQFKPC